MNKVMNDNESVCSNVSSTNNAEIIAAVFATTSSDKWADENCCSMSTVSTNSNSQALSTRTNRTSTTNTNGNQDEDDETSTSDVLIDVNNDHSEKASEMNSNEVDEEEDDESIADDLSDDDQESSNENDDNRSHISATSSSQMVIITDSDDFVRTKATDSTKSDKDEKHDKDERFKKEKKKPNDTNTTNKDKLGKQSKTEFKQKRHRRTKMQMMKDAEKAAAAAQSAMDAVCASVLKKANQTAIKKSHTKLNISKKNKKFDSKLPTNFNSKRLLRSTNGTMPQNDTRKSKQSSTKTYKKNDKKSKEAIGDQLNGEHNGDDEDEDDDEYEDDLNQDQIVTDEASNKMSNENKVKKNYYQLNKLKRQQHLLLMQKQHEHKQQLKNAQKKLLKSKQSEDFSSKQKTSQTLSTLKNKLKRKCLVCKRKVHQDLLNEHLIEHFNESSKCVECEKVSTNPSNFVTHILSHLDNQFLCINCDKWFKQPVLYKRHKEQCELDQQRVEPKVEESLKIVPQHQPKQRGRPRLHKNMPYSSQVSKSSSQTSIQTAKSSNVKTSTQMSIPKRLGRPPKYLKQDSTKQPTEQPTTTTKDQLKTSKRTKITPSQTSEDNLDEINVSDYEQDEEEEENEKEIGHLRQKTQRDEIKEEQSDEVKEQEAKRNMRKKLEAIPPSLTEQQKDHLSKIVTTGGGALANAIASLALKPSNNDLKTCGTYKVKLEIRKPNKPKEEAQTSTTSRENSLNRSASFNMNDLKQTPSKSSSMINSFISTSKNSQLISSSSQSLSQQTNLPSSSFECPECKRKFVSYYGLVQHYDQHPNLAVTCFICEITFDNHNSLVQHNANLHHQQENASQKDQKKGNTKTGKQANGVQQTTNQKGRNVQETVDSNGLNEITNTLPSIMTRTSRQNNNNAHQQPSIFNQLKLANSANQTSVLMNHSLTVKTSGFADLAFIDFSCTSFPRIAQSYCELWPRRIQSNQQQPLHKYSCDQCGFYFPCRASLKLHMLKKQFASSKLAINDTILNNLDNLDALKIRNNCKLFMTNSKYMDYEKTLDEIINTLEKNEKKVPNQSSTDAQMAFSQSSRKDILKSLGLVHKNELNELKDKYTVTQTTMNASQLISLNKELNLEEFISFSSKPKLVSKNKILMLELRKQMLDINHQFEIDLNRWKYMHFHYPASTGIQSNKNSFPIDIILEQYANKVQMKPHVNLNRPLLIRSKRLKRNTQKLQPQPNQIVTQPTKTAASLSTYSSSTTYASNTKSNFYEKQPVFSATSGNFSASNQLNLNKKRKLNERDQENQFVVVVSKQELKRSKQRIQQQQELHEEIERQRESELKEHLVSRKRRKGLTKRNEDEKEFNSHRHGHFEHFDEDAHDALELQDEESDQDFEQLEYQKSKQLTNKYKKQKAQESKQESNDKEAKQETQKSQLKANKSSTSINSNSGQKFPAPPVLLKTVNTSANSSILARASGMSMNHLVKQMPKLQPINPQPQMPKLKPISQMNKSEVSKRVQNGPIPSPPQLILAKNKHVSKSNDSGENKNKKQLTNGYHNHVNDHAVQEEFTVDEGEEYVEKEVSTIEKSLVNNENHQEEEEGEESEGETPTDEEEQSEENNGMIDSLVKLKNSEHLSLKCKFCYLIFKVQSDFFQHVITNHPKMLKKCLNRAEQNSTKKLSSKTSNHSSTSKNKTHNKKEINLTNETQLISEFLSTSSK